jgi:hypothetical protein
MPNGSKGHLVRIRDSDSNGGFQIAAVPDSDQIGKFRHIADEIQGCFYRSLVAKVDVRRMLLTNTLFA